MKRFFAWITALLMLLSLAACSSTQTSTAAASQQASTSETGKSENELIAEENDILAANNALWEKVFASMDKNVTDTTLSSNYGDILMSALDHAKDQFTDEEYAALKADADKIREIETQIAALPQDEAASQSMTQTASTFPQFEGKDLMKLSDDEMCRIRGNEIAMIFQEPMTALNPLFTCGYQISEVLRMHQGLDKRAARKQAVELMRMVGIPIPEKRVNNFPHQLSGGMRQRVMIAMALACKPKLLIADEPTTALDVTIQAQIMKLIRDLKEEMNMALILITHDMGVVAEMAERVIVMYAGNAVEEADVKTLFKSPLHPYTQGLLESIPRLEDEGKEDLKVIDGSVPGLHDMPKGCRFSPRCAYCTGHCTEELPPLVDVGGGHKVRCFKAMEQQEVPKV